MNASLRAVYLDEVHSVLLGHVALLELLAAEPGQWRSSTLHWVTEELMRLLVRRSELDRIFLELDLSVDGASPEVEQEERIRAKKRYSSCG
jgi:hypothetical protein